MNTLYDGPSLCRVPPSQWYPCRRASLPRSRISQSRLRALDILDIDCLLGPWLLVRSLLVGADVEHDEEHEVRRQDEAPGHGCIGVAGTGTHVRKPADGRAHPVVPGSKVDDACVQWLA